MSNSESLHERSASSEELRRHGHERSSTGSSRIRVHVWLPSAEDSFTVRSRTR
jgi:hypothetical protein